MRLLSGSPLSPAPLARRWLRGRLNEDALSNNAQLGRIRYSYCTGDVSNSAALSPRMQSKPLHVDDVLLVSALNMGIEIAS